MIPNLLYPIVALSLTLSAVCAENWPEFRGPGEQGHAPEGARLPLHWSETENIAWKTEIRGKAWSSPVIWNDRIWVTNADEGGTRLSAVCLDKNSGKILHDKRVRTVAGPQYCHPFNSYGSPSPVIDGDHVYLSFGAPWTGCLDAATGDLIWERTDLECNHFRGPGSSPYVHGNLREFKVLAENQLDDGVMASPAVSGNALFVRTRTHLYRIEER